ncbi:MAG: ABC transporter ATP-binding protein [Planctomyces sp.]|nr:ABC transporter ATP-binding protein [Planctomyces sp.]
MAQVISLAVESVVRRFGERLALDGMSFQLNRGEFLGLLGPNGAGKTTLIRAIAGRLRLDSGRVLIESTPVVPGQKNSATHRLGVIPQNIAIYGKLTARENLELFGRLYGVSPSDLPNRINETLDWIGLSDRADEPAGRFSGGMQRRLNIGCGVLHQPDLILLDEPTVGVDPQSRQKIWEMLKSIQNRGVSVLLTTHQLDEAQQVCDRIVIVDHGKTVAAGTFEQLLEQSIGRQRTVRLKTSAVIDAVPPGCVLKESGELSFVVSDIATELPAMLRTIADADFKIDDISIDVPGLQSVFLHFTGRELRES